MTLDSRNDLTNSNTDHILTFSHITHLRFYFRPFNVLVLEHLLKSLPSIKRFSIDTLIYNSDYIRAPFWTLLFQKYLLFLERIRLVVRCYPISKTKDTIDGIQDNLIDGYQYDRYWIDRAYKKIFMAQTNTSSTVLQIR